MGIENAAFLKAYEFDQAGSIAAATTALGVNGRDSVSVAALAAANVILYTAPDGAGSIDIRFRANGSENDNIVVNLYAARASGDRYHYHLVATLTMQQGAQDSTSEHFIDVITPSVEDPIFEAVEFSCTDGIGHYELQTKGYNKFLFITTTHITGKLLYIDVARIE